MPYNGNPNNRVGGYEVATGRKKADGTDETKWSPVVRKVVNWEN
ncbi:hypothetical protein NXX82_22600 [Bacteroides fragilis]|nr:hypothetical protein [Bacteroides fragilis]